MIENMAVISVNRLVVNMPIILVAILTIMMKTKFTMMIIKLKMMMKVKLRRMVSLKKMMNK